MLIKNFFAFILILFLFACSKDENIYKPSLKIDPYKSYKEALDAFNNNQYFIANKKFSEAEINFKNPNLAAKSAIMGSYSLYGINKYGDAEENLNRYLTTYPADKYVIYAHYLLAIIYFEQIGNAEHDLKPLLAAQKKIDFFLEKYPKSEYAIDLKFKKNLVQNQFAAKELYIAKYYISVQKWVPAISRLKLIVQDYNETVFIEEALHRLVEINYHLGIKDEAEKYASILGYNYNSSEWYKQSYKILNKKYEISENNSINENKGLLKKILDKIR